MACLFMIDRALNFWLLAHQHYLVCHASLYLNDLWEHSSTFKLLQTYISCLVPAYKTLDLVGSTRVQAKYFFCLAGNKHPCFSCSCLSPSLTPMTEKKF
jgi:hypothetical protein